MRSVKALPAALLASVALAGCSSLLPRSESAVRTEWQSFDDAKAVIEHLVPNRTTRAELNAAGLDPYTNPNVELLNFSDVLRRFPLSGSLTHVDPGLRECLDAGRRCTGYSIVLNQQRRDRVGPFLLDLLSFRRETVGTGWTFDALVLLVNDKVVYALYGGKPAISTRETTIDPLGPLQNWDASTLVK